jgi:hypothetical protein
MNNNDFSAVHTTLCRFFAAFDKRDWASMIDCLADEVFVDYSSSGREAPTKMKGEAFVSRRKMAIDNLSKQHSFSNLFVQRDPDKSALTASCNYLILRFDLSNADQHTNFFHSCGQYEFEMVSIEKGCKISSIRQFKLQSWGDEKLHGGLSATSD